MKLPERKARQVKKKTQKQELVELAETVLYNLEEEDYETALDWALQLAGLVTIARDNANR